MNEEEKLLIRKTQDLLTHCDKYLKPQFSFFLNEAQQAIIEREIGEGYGYSCEFYGGYDNSQRKIFGVFPQWEEASFEQFPIKVLKIKKSFGKALSHRDFLGSILSLGINREQVGDIIICDDIAYVFIVSDMADFVRMGLKKIGNVGVKTDISQVHDIVIPEPEFKVINTVCASQRIDAIVGAMLNVSRKESSALVFGGNVSVNHFPVTDISKKINVGDILSVKGYGRFIFSAVGDKTRSERIHITVKKYV